MVNKTGAVEQNGMLPQCVVMITNGHNYRSYCSYASTGCSIMVDWRGEECTCSAVVDDAHGGVALKGPHISTFGSVICCSVEGVPEGVGLQTWKCSGSLDNLLRIVLRNGKVALEADAASLSS